jgi:hypothetical protein
MLMDIAAHAKTPEPIARVPQIYSDFLTPYENSFHLRLCPILSGHSHCFSYEREGEARTSFDETWMIARNEQLKKELVKDPIQKAAPSEPLLIFDRDVFDTAGPEEALAPGWSATCIYFDGTTKRIEPNESDTTCWPKEHKPKPKDCPPGWACGTLKAPEPRAITTIHHDGDQTFEWTIDDTNKLNNVFFTIHSDGEWEMSPQFWKQIESHCVAVLTEKHTVHHKRTISGGEIPDDRMEWDDEIPEQTLRLKCSEKLDK